MKSGDRLMLIVILAALIVYGGSLFIDEKSAEQMRVEISLNGEVLDIIDLPYAGSYEKTYRYDGYENIVRIEEGDVYMAEANCPSQQCVHQGKISKVGQSIVCLPSRLVITIIAKETDLDAVVK